MQPPESQVRLQSLLLPARKKYADLDDRYIFEPIAIESLGVSNTSVCQLLSDLGRKIFESNGETREASFLFQRCSVLVHRFNATLIA